MGSVKTGILLSWRPQGNSRFLIPRKSLQFLSCGHPDCLRHQLIPTPGSLLVLRRSSSSKSFCLSEMRPLVSSMRVPQHKINLMPCVPQVLPAQERAGLPPPGRSSEQVPATAQQARAPGPGSGPGPGGASPGQGRPRPPARPAHSSSARRCIEARGAVPAQTAAPGSAGSAPAAPAPGLNLHKWPQTESAGRSPGSSEGAVGGLLGTWTCASSCAQSGPLRIPCHVPHAPPEVLCPFHPRKVFVSFAKSR